jgi:GDP-L-fucose synthase
MNPQSKVIVTGGSGLVGYALRSHLPEALYLSSKDCDLTNFKETSRLFNDYRPSVVLHLAAKVGGVKANMSFLGDFFRENSQINLNVLECSRLNNVKKVISLLSTCVYPDEVIYPLTEDQIHLGPPHPSNYAYAYAKRMLDIQSQSYRDQYGCNFITAIPNNLYGPNDNYDLENSHVIPALMRKIHEAKINNTEVVVWGDGSPLREFTYSDDLAKILICLMEKYNSPEPINVGNTSEYSLKSVVETLCNVMDYKGEIIWDTSKPMGQHKKPSSNKKLLNLGWDPEDYSDLKQSLTITYKWFKMNYPHLRGINK